MKSHFVFAFALLVLSLSAQDIVTPSSFDTDVKHAYTNAMKGIYFALENIPESKSSLKSDLIEGDNLLAEIHLTKEINGVKIESKGVHKTYTVEITVYRSYASLENDGYR